MFNSLRPPWPGALSAPLFMGFSRQEYWSGLPFPSTGNFPKPEIASVSLTSPALAGTGRHICYCWATREARALSYWLELFSDCVFLLARRLYYLQIMLGFFPLSFPPLKTLFSFYSFITLGRYLISSVQFSHSVMSDSLRTHRLQHAWLPCPLPYPGAYPNSCPVRRWCHPTISCSVVPFSSRLQSFPASGSFQMSQFFASGGQSTGVSAQHQSFQLILRTDLLSDGLVGTPCCPRNSQQSSPTPQFKSISSSVLRFLYGPTLTSIHDYWKTHSFDNTDLCWQSNVSAF